MGALRFKASNHYYYCLREDGSKHRCAHFLQQLAGNQPQNYNDITHLKTCVIVFLLMLRVLPTSRV